MTDRYTRTFADFENHPWPGKILPEYFEQIANAGDGNAGLQRMIQGALSAYGAYHVIEGCEYQSPGVPTEWTGSIGYMMYSGLIKSVAAASGALSAAGSYLIYNSAGTFAVTGAKPTGVILAHNIGGTVYTVNTRHDTSSNFYLPNTLSVYGETYIKNNLTVSGSINLTGVITYIGNSTQSGYTFQTGNIYRSGYTFNTGNIYHSGDTQQTGYTFQTGNIYHSGHTEHIGDISGMYPYSISGYETITADTGQFKHITGFSSVYVDTDLDFSDGFDIFGVVQLTGSLVRVGTAGGLTVGTHTLTDAEWKQLTGIGSSTVSPTQWDYLGAMNQHVHSDGDPVFDTLTLDAAGLTVGSVTLSNNEWTQLANIGDSITIAAGDWRNITGMQPVGTIDSPSFAGLTMNGNIVMGSDDITFSAGGTVDGIDVGALNTNYVDHRDNQASAHHVKTVNTWRDVSSIQEVFAVGKIISTANSEANALQIGNGSKAVKISQGATHVTMYQSDSVEGQERGYLGSNFALAIRPFSQFHCRLIYSDDGTVTAYSHVDDLQLLRDVKEWDVREKIVNEKYPEFTQKVFDVGTLPWVKAHPDVDNMLDDDNEKRYMSSSNQRDGYFLSSMKKILEIQDSLVSGLVVRDMIIEDLQTRLDVLEGA